jgi:hypothetical protein
MQEGTGDAGYLPSMLRPSVPFLALHTHREKEKKKGRKEKRKKGREKHKERIKDKEDIHKLYEIVMLLYYKGLDH